MQISVKGAAAALTLAASLLAGCVPLMPLMIGGAVVGGGMVAVDRRTSGTVVEDQGIEFKAAARLRENIGERAHINVTAYNRQVLLTGEVPTEQDKALANQVVANVENVHAVLNELAVAGNTTFSQRSGDTLVTGRAKAALVDAKDLTANAFKLTTERGTLYLMGRVTEREAKRATDIVSGISGVQRVVRVLEIISEDELSRMLPQPAPGAPASAPIQGAQGESWGSR